MERNFEREVGTRIRSSYLMVKTTLLWEITLATVCQRVRAGEGSRRHPGVGRLGSD